MKKSQGFTLIELMITVVIIGILAAVAIPNYYQYMARTGRSDAAKGLDYLAACQERYYWQNQTYTDELDKLGCGTTTPDGYYKFSVGLPPVASDGYTLTATAVATGPQAKDTPCLTITLNSAGQRTPAACW
ncbi:MAG: type IV pilin protein [Gammaproteobacteria bacterium]